jgi:hypothetical protein
VVDVGDYGDVAQRHAVGDSSLRSTKPLILSLLGETSEPWWQTSSLLTVSIEFPLPRPFFDPFVVFVRVDP